MPLQIRRGTEAERLSLTTANGLLQGELLYNTSDKRVYIGTGVSGEHQGIPVTGYTTEDAQDAAAGLFTSGAHGNISFAYDDTANTLNATVDLTDYEGVLKADAFNGTLVADDSSVLVDAIDGKINLDGTVKGNIIPDANEAYDIGSASNRFKDIYLSGSSIYLGTANITALAGIVNLPAGSTIGGVEIGTAVSQDTAFVRDLQGSVFGDDSTLLVNSIDNILSNGSVFLEGFSLYSESDTLSLYGSSSSQTQVRFPFSAASTTAGDILTATGTWNIVEILSGVGGDTPTVDLTGGEVLGVINITGIQANGVDMGAVIGAQVDPAGTPSASWIPSKIFFGNSPDNSLANPALMTFDSFGRLAVNQQNAQATLDVNGFAKLAVLETAPSSPANGMIAIASGDQGAGEWDPLSAGAKQQMVVYLGGGWRQIAVEP